MIILRDISIMWALIHTLVLFMLLFQSRYPRKKTITITLATMLPLIAVNFALFLLFDFNGYGTLMLFTLSLPSMILFWVLAEHRDGRFFFTFCVVDTVVLEIVYITSILNYYFTPDTYLVLFIIRLLAYPLLELFTYKRLRKVYLEVQEHTAKGWWSYAAIGAIFYLATTLLMNYPVIIMNRTDDMPALILLFLLMPIIYVNIFSTLRHQQQFHEITQQDNILRLQVANMTTRMEEYSAADSKFRMERHNFRHKMQMVAHLAETQQYSELQKLISEYCQTIQDTQIQRYCQNPVIDAVLATYLQTAERKGIQVTTRIAFPDTLTVSDTELATVFANAIENAIQACEKLEQEKRQIEVKILSKPNLMLQITNSFDGVIEFDNNHIPISREHGHGLGTRSIVAFCEKNHAFYEFSATDDIFSLRIMLR